MPKFCILGRQRERRNSLPLKPPERVGIEDLIADSKGVTPEILLENLSSICLEYFEPELAGPARNQS